MQCSYVALHLGLVQLKVLEVGEALQCGYVARHLGLVQVKVLEVGEAFCSTAMSPFTWVWER